MKRLLLAAAAIATLAIPAAAQATNSCGTINCGAGASINQPLFLVQADITATVLTTKYPTKTSSSESALADITVCRGSYCIVAGLAYGNDWAFGPNNDFVIRSTGPNGQNTYWYTAANWQPSTPYTTTISANGGNSWDVTVGPFHKTILNNGMIDYANYGAVDSGTDDSCPSGLDVTHSNMGWWADVNGVAIPQNNFPSGSKYTFGAESASWINPYYALHETVAATSC